MEKIDDIETPNIINVKNAEGDPDTVAEIIVQNKIDYTPKVSVVVPVYNVELYLRQCLDSIINQTLKEIEIICVDDGSTDASLEILKEYATKDDRITVIAQKNAGSGKARNNGINNAKGEFIAFMDSDDMYPSEKTLEHMYKAAIDNDVLICGGSLSQLREGGKIVTDPKEFEEGYSFKEEGIVDFCDYQFDFGYWRFIYNRKFLKEHELLFPDYIRCQDPPFFVKTMCVAGNFYALKEPTYVYRVSYKQISWNERKVVDVYKARIDLLHMCETYMLYELYKRISSYITSEYLFKQISDLVENNQNVRFYIRKAVEAIDTDKITDSKTLKSRYAILKKLQVENQPYKPTTGVSIIIPCYDVEPYLRQCLDSVINQTMKNIQIICINDESPDNSLEILKEYAAKDDRIVVIDQKNQGLSGSRNNALKIITGEYVEFLDSDDWLRSDTVELLYNKAKKYDLDVLNFEGWNYFPESDKYVQDKVQRIDYLPFEKPYYDKDDIEQFAHLIPVSSCRFFYKASFIKEHNYTFPEGLCFEDNLFTRRAFCEMSRFGVEKSVLYNRRMHEGQITANFDKLFKDYLTVVSRIAKYYVERGYENKKSIQSIISVYCEQIIKRFISFSLENQALYISSLLRFFNDISQNFTLSPDVSKYIKNIDANYLYRKMWEEWCNSSQKNFNVDNPKTFDEKIQWLKLYYSTPNRTRLADKYLVREWIKDKIGEKYLIPLLGAYDNFRDIDFDKLPNQFVIKCNHGSGYNIIVKDKSKFDIQDAKKKINKWMKENFAFQSGVELQYMNMKPKIIIEKFIENKSKNDLYDYKFYCFNGVPEYVQFISDRNGHDIKMSFYDMDWKKQSFYNNYQFDPSIKPCPESFAEMKKLASILSKGISYVRVDLYQLDDGSIYFGEMTFSPASGSMVWSSSDIDMKLGSMIELPKKTYDINTNKYYKIQKSNKFISYILFPYYLCKTIYMQKKYISAYVNKLKKNITPLRIDIKNFGTENNDLKIDTKANAFISKPAWFTNTEGMGHLVRSLEHKMKINIKVINDGNLVFFFRGDNRLLDGKRFPVWIDYKSIKIDGHEILSSPIATWHDEPYRYEIPVKDGQELILEVEQQYHEYTKDELKDLLLKLNANDEFVRENIEKITEVFCKQLPIIDESVRKEREISKHVSEILRGLTAYRIDIKNCGISSNSFEINTSDGRLEEPKWLTNEQGIGKMLQGNAMNNTIKLKIINDGNLKIDFRGQDKRHDGKRFPLWIDYKSIKIDSREILSYPVATWHDKTYHFEMSVKDGQEIIVEVEQQYHQYTEEELKDIIIKLNPSNDYIAKNLNKLSAILYSETHYYAITPVISVNSEIDNKNSGNEADIYLRKLNSSRIDIKNVGIFDNKVVVSSENGNVTKPKYLSDESGVGVVVQNTDLHNVIKVKSVNSGILKIYFRGHDKRFNGERFPLWIDYKSIKIDGKEILSAPVATWHDKPYHFEMPVKDGQEVIVEIELQYHKYNPKDMYELISKLFADDKNFISKKDNIIDYICKKYGIDALEFRHTWPYVKNEILNKVPLPVAIDNVSKDTNGLISINIGYTKFEGILLPHKNKKLYVFLSASGNKQPYPLFHRISWCDYFNDGVCLYLDDPTRFENRMDSIAFYFGRKDTNYLEYIYQIVCNVASVHGISYENIVFISSSNGGFAALYCANKINGCKCIVSNPQVDIPTYVGKNSVFENVFDIDFSDEKLKNRINVCNILNNTKSKFFIFCNIRCRLDKPQIELLCKCANKSPVLGYQKLTNNVEILIADISYSDPHLCQADENFVRFIEQHIGEDKSDEYNLFVREMKKYYDILQKINKDSAA